MITQTVTFADRKPDTKIVYLGNEDENHAESIKFALPAWLSAARASLFLSLGDYTDIVSLEPTRIYKPTLTHMSRPGVYSAYVTANLGDDIVWNSDIFQISIRDLPEYAEQIEQENPTILDQALQILSAITGIGVKAVTLDPGSDATVEIQEDATGNKTIVYGIPEGLRGLTGYIFTPSVSSEGVLSWSNNGGLVNPEPVNIKGAKGDKGEFATVDSELSETSTNPVQNKVVKKAIDDAKITVDAELSDTSTNPVQNKVVKKAIDDAKVTVDSELSETSTNPVQNKVVMEGFQIILSEFQTILSEFQTISSAFNISETDLVAGTSTIQSGSFWFIYE